ncbi:MAG: HAD family hydrolase [Acidobacteriales bacterium]|nr:HAD family hydrolase [Terriglobales bacterium]
MISQTGAIFLDRDGVVNQNRADHVKTCEEFEFVPGALEGIRSLTETGLPIFIITNQAAISRKLMTVEALDSIHDCMMRDITKAGGVITRVYHCPHDSHENCTCRKPMPGMLWRAASDFGIDLRRSFLVGDAWTDINAGLEVGAHSILVMTGRGRWNFVPCWQRFGLEFAAAYDLLDASMMIKEALRGNRMQSTIRLRNALRNGLQLESLGIY